MSAEFERCVSTKGSKVKTRDLGKGKYQRFCILGNKAIAGEVKTRKNPKK